MTTVQFKALAICLVSSFFPFILFSQQVQEVKEIVEETKITGSEFSEDVTKLFEAVETAADEANKISKRLEKKYSNNESLSLSEREGLAKTIREIHELYKSIDLNRETYQRLLNRYDLTMDQYIERARNIKSDYQRDLDKNSYKKELLVNKPNRTEIDEDDLKACMDNIKIIEGILTYMNRFMNEIEGVKKNYVKINDDVSRFLNYIKNGAETTKYLTDYFEFTLEFEKVKENADNIVKLSDLREKMSESLKNLANSIEQLERAADQKILVN